MNRGGKNYNVTANWNPFVPKMTRQTYYGLRSKKTYVKKNEKASKVAPLWLPKSATNKLWGIKSQLTWEKLQSYREEVPTNKSTPNRRQSKGNRKRKDTIEIDKSEFFDQVLELLSNDSSNDTSLAEIHQKTILNSVLNHLLTKITENDQQIYGLMIERLYIEKTLISTRKRVLGILHKIKKRRNDIMFHQDKPMLQTLSLRLNYYVDNECEVLKNFIDQIWTPVPVESKFKNYNYKHIINTGSKKDSNENGKQDQWLETILEILLDKSIAKWVTVEVNKTALIDQ